MSSKNENENENEDDYETIRDLKDISDEIIVKKKKRCKTVLALSQFW